MAKGKQEWIDFQITNYFKIRSKSQKIISLKIRGAIAYNANAKSMNLYDTNYDNLRKNK